MAIDRCVVTALLLCLLAWPARAQDLPVDPELRFGQLSNGLTYYIRHNETPDNRAEFWLVQNTGSIVEEDNERGLSHFLEHMAFKGSEHFPGSQLSMYLQELGVPFGSDINASTSYDDTRFRFSNVPANRSGVIDTMLLALRDISCGLSLDSADIEHERNVVYEEWHTGNDHNMRMYERVLPSLMSGSRYANRIAIGDMNVVRRFKREQLVDFYHKWYRPGLQAVVIVGDIDVDYTEQTLKRVMGSMNALDGPQRNFERVPDNLGVNYASYADPEATNSLVYLFYKHDRTMDNTMASLRQALVSSLVQNMLAQRLNECAQANDAPLSYATVIDRNYIVARGKQALTLIAMANGCREREALNLLITESARAVLHGFTRTELERAVKEARANIESMLANVDHHPSQDYVDEYIDHYANGGFIPGIKREAALDLETLATISLQEVNTYLRNIVGHDNVCTLISGPQRNDCTYPAASQVIADFYRITHDTSLSPYSDVVQEESLLPQLPQPGKITQETTDAHGVTTWHLENGATVLLKPTTFSSGEILFNAMSLGGEWTFGDTADINVKVMDQIIEESAPGGFTSSELSKMLAGHQLGLSFSLNDPTQQFSGGCMAKDLEQLLQINYLYFTDIRKNEKTFTSFKSKLRSRLMQQAHNPKAVLGDSIGSTLYMGNPMYRNISADDVDNINIDRVMALYRQLVSNAANYTFSLVGDIDLEVARRLVETYIASLPGDPRNLLRSDYVAPLATASTDNRFSTPMRTPHSTVYVTLTGAMPYTFEDELRIDLVGSAVGAALMSYLRQEKHGVYDVACDGALSLYHNRWMLNYEFETDTASRDEMIACADYAVKEVFRYGISETLFSKIKAQALSQYQQSVKTNNYWITVLQQRTLGIDVSRFEEILGSITLETFNSYLQSLHPTTQLRIIQN